MMSARSLNERVHFVWEAMGVKRCHTFPLIGEYTVGQHSANAVALYVLVCPEPSKLVMETLLFHDCAERIVGDVPWHSKKQWIHLDQALDDAEHEVLSEYGLPDGSQLGMSDEVWVAWADMMEFIMMCRHQQKMGNTLVEPYLKNAQMALGKLCQSAGCPEAIKDYHFRQGGGIHRVGDFIK